MNDLVINYNGTPATTQDKVSVLTDNNEQSVQRLIRTYEADLREFGELNFHNVQVKAGLGLTYRKVYCLNEQQATLLLTYMKNTAKVREAKKILVKAFYDMRQKLQECQINGYKSQIAQHNTQIVELKNKLAKFEKAYEPEVLDITDEIKRLKLELEIANTKNYYAFYKNALADAKFYRDKYYEAKDNRAKDERVIVSLSRIQKDAEAMFLKIGAVMAYIDNDKNEDLLIKRIDK
ncbi:Rha family transcriptional regulator [uncultured Campylobacter sp.]|uniref:Rha family transcriptional regulator n=1 Tax=uncultured Campylobacter sp. TaxID=218934 RepID=UPI003211C78E